MKRNHHAPCLTFDNLVKSVVLSLKPTSGHLAASLEVTKARQEIGPNGTVARASS